MRIKQIDKLSMPNMRFKMLNKPNKNINNLDEEDFDNILENLDKPSNQPSINGHKAYDSINNMSISDLFNSGF